MTRPKKHGIGRFSALKTSIALGDFQSVVRLLGSEPLLDIEKSYLIDLAKLNNNAEVIKVLEAMPEKKS